MPAANLKNQTIMIYKSVLKMFNENFDRQAYDQAKAKVENIIGQPNSLEFIMQMTDGYDDCYDDCDNTVSFYCEVELDRSRMETEADFVSVEFLVEYDRTAMLGRIDSASLYIGFPGDSCRIYLLDPETCIPTARE